jgi:hypothetical protein
MQLTSPQYLAWVTLLVLAVGAAAWHLSTRTFASAMDACVVLLAGIGAALAAHKLFGEPASVQPPAPNPRQPGSRRTPTP